MSDEELRSLVRCVRDDIPATKLRIEAHWRRLGLSIPHEYVKIGRGWHGNRLLWNDHGNMAAEGVENVYRWLGGPLAALVLELVYIPGGDIGCHNCFGGRNDSMNFDCPLCHNSGRLEVEPFYIGRFPVTVSQFAIWKTAAGRGWMHIAGENVEAYEEGARHYPIAPTSPKNALEFCEWSGLRLPSPQEWFRAALGGPPVKCLREGCEASGRGGYFQSIGGEMVRVGKCLSCDDTGIAPRHHPWGNEPICSRRFAATPAAVLVHQQSEEWAGRPDQAPYVPARPEGASHFGAHDMAGNVWEMIDAAERTSLIRRELRLPPTTSPAGGVIMALGGPGAPAIGWHSNPTPMNVSALDVGFRVALSAEP